MKTHDQCQEALFDDVELELGFALDLVFWTEMHCHPNRNQLTVDLQPPSSLASTLQNKVLAARSERAGRLLCKIVDARSMIGMTLENPSPTSHMGRIASWTPSATSIH